MKVPLGRPGQPEEVAELIDFLLGSGGRYIVGSVVLFDGGIEARIRPDDWPTTR